MAVLLLEWARELAAAILLAVRRHRVGSLSDLTDQRDVMCVTSIHIDASIDGRMNTVAEYYPVSHVRYAGNGQPFLIGTSDSSASGKRGLRVDP